MLCASNKCGVCECDEDEVPKEWDQLSNTSPAMGASTDFLNKNLGQLDKLSIKSNGATTTSDWIFNEELDKEALYINLMENSEAFTAYNGSHIWNKIYEENCFGEEATCSEHQLLYRLVSGVHANVNMHISHYFSDLGSDEVYQNYDMYYERVGSQEEWIKNMHFAYSFVLRAINREADKLKEYKFKGISDEETV